MAYSHDIFIPMLLGWIGGDGNFHGVTVASSSYRCQMCSIAGDLAVIVQDKAGPLEGGLAP